MGVFEAGKKLNCSQGPFKIRARPLELIYYSPEIHRFIRKKGAEILSSPKQIILIPAPMRVVA